MAPRAAGWVLAAVLAVGGCATAPVEEPATGPPRVSDEVLRERARAALAAGLRLYETGDFAGSATRLQASLDHGMLPRGDQGTARKHLAFIHCLAGRDEACQAEFRKGFEIDPAFALSPAEDGHPAWGPAYRRVRDRLAAPATTPAAPPREAMLLKAEKALSDGLARYEAGDFAEAHRLLDLAFREGLQSRPDQVLALKHSAFSLCLMQRWPACREQFLRIFEIEPGFDLAAAEAGHPSWARTFAGARAQARKARADKAARPREPAARKDGR